MTDLTHITFGEIIARIERIERVINLSLPNASEIVETGQTDQQKTIQTIIKIVADYFGITTEQILSDLRHKEICEPRFLAALLAKDITDASQNQLTIAFRYREHSGIMHALKRAKELCSVDPEFEGHFSTLHALALITIKKPRRGFRQPTANGYPIPNGTSRGNEALTPSLECGGLPPLSADTA